MMSSIVCLAAMLGVAAMATLQSVAVTGRLTCNGQPYSGARIKLYDDNTLTPDSKLGEVTSDSNGNFNLTGSTSNLLFNQDPKFNIYHRCGMTVPVCYYKSSYKIPSQYVSNGATASQVYNAQTIELSMLETDRDCLNRRK
ncbi:unnamed protein product, partial [Mesorhabditis spiculigera]